MIGTTVDVKVTELGSSAYELPRPVDLSVIVVSWNTRELLRDCLRSLFCGGLSGIAEAEVWVVDNGSKDGSAAMVREEFPETKLLANRENAGFARANNQALDRAAGRYYLLLNSDTVVPPASLAGLLDAMDAHLDAAVCSPLLLDASGAPQICWARFPGFRSELTGRLDRGQCPYPIMDFAIAEKRSRMEAFYADWVGGACFVVRAEAATRTGAVRLDESFFMYGEETDWCRRFRDAGAKTLLVPGVTVTHLGGQSSRRTPLATRRRLYASSLRLYRRLYGPVGALPAMVVATARLLSSLVKPGDRLAAARRPDETDS